MAPGLYGDLPQAKGGSEEAPSWGATPKLQPQLRKPPVPLAPPPSVLRAAAGRGGRGAGTPGRGGGRSGPGPVALAGELGDVQPVRPNAASATADAPAVAAPVVVAPASIFTHVTDEYDPMRPNDYEEVLRERERIKREAEAEAERAAKLREVEAAMERARSRDAEGPGSYTAAAPPAALNVSGDEAYQRRARAGQAAGPLPGPPGLPPAAPTPGPSAGSQAEAGAGAGAAGAGAGAGGDAASGKGMTLAQKLLMKMGWREGEGLGRERQGISTPLVMQKTNARAGVIVAAEPSAGGPAEKKARTGAMIVGQPSRVLCLRNMVGPGQVDEELEEEVGLECSSKYGPVTSVLIFEITQPGYEAEEAVRIFVQFERQESAMKALVDLQGRFFAGRQVRAAFFSEERFAATDLAPRAGEFDS